MTWVFPKEKLQFYNPSVAGCYADWLGYPADMILQGNFGAGSKDYTIKLEVYSVDGATLYEDATPYFKYYFSYNVITGGHTFTAQLNSYSPQMCLHPCFVIKVTVYDDAAGDLILFEYFTQQFRIANCCDIPRGTVLSDEEIDPADLPTTTTTSNVPVDECGKPLLRLESYFDCDDAFTGEIYTPGNAFTGTYFPYRKVSNFRGRLVPRPYEISKQVSYNNVTQRIEIQRPYLLEGYEAFPAYKMLEITSQLQSQHLNVTYNGEIKFYRYDSGTPFDKNEGARECEELFKLNATLTDIVLRQTLGCNTSCQAASPVIFFVVPLAYTDGNFYDGNGTYIANSLESLAVWLSSQNGVTSVEIQDLSCLDCEIAGAIKVEGTGTLPSTLFYNNPVPSSKMYAITIDDFCAICAYVGATQCTAPVIGTIVETEDVCDTPIVIDVIETDVTPEELELTNQGGWVYEIPLTSASLVDSTVTIQLHTENSIVFIGNVGDTILFTNEVIASINLPGRPTAQVFIDNSMNGSVPLNIVIAINTDGTIVANGYDTLVNVNSYKFALINLTYNI